MKIKLEDLKVQSFITSLGSQQRTIHGGMDGVAAETSDDVETVTVDGEDTKQPQCVTGLQTLYTNRTVHTRCVPQGCNC